MRRSHRATRGARLAALALVVSAASLLPTAIGSASATTTHAGSTCAPEISTVGQLAASAAQALTITGSCLGAGGSFTDGDSPYLAIADTTSGWQGCSSATSPGDDVTCDVSAWTDTSIRFSGFAGAYGSGGAELKNGDTLVVSVWNPQTGTGPATCTVTAGGTGFTVCDAVAPQLGAGSAFEGWGVSFAWWSQVAGSWTGTTGATGRSQLAELLYGSPTSSSGVLYAGSPLDALGMTVIRYNLGASSPRGVRVGNACTRPFGTGKAVPSVAAGPTSYSLRHDPAGVAMLRDALGVARRAGATPIVQAFANSPPWWLLPSRCPQEGGTLPSGKFDAYASYLLRAVQLFRAHGITFNSVEAFNEPDLQWGANAACAGGGPCVGCQSASRRTSCQEGATFSAASQQSILAAMCRLRGWGTTRIAAPDDNVEPDTFADLTGFETRGYLTAASTSCISQMDTHSYGTGASAPDQPQDVAEAQALRSLDKPLWVSEYGAGGDAVPLAAHIAQDLDALQPSVWDYWTALDGSGGWGLFTDKAYARPATPATFASQLVPTGRYVGLSMYSRFIRPGATLYAVDPTSAGLVGATPSNQVYAVIARNAAGSVTVVLTNVGSSAANLHLDLSGLLGGTVTARRYLSSSSWKDLAQGSGSITGSAGSLACVVPANTTETLVVP